MCGSHVQTTELPGVLFPFARSASCFGMHFAHLRIYGSAVMVSCWSSGLAGRASTQLELSCVHAALQSPLQSSLQSCRHPEVGQQSLLRITPYIYRHLRS